MSSKTLILLRHAKSSWKRPELDDRDRPLNSRGRQAADRIGRLIQDEAICPEIVMCSTSTRTRETAARVFAGAITTPIIQFRDDLYHADPDQIRSAIKQTSDDYSTVMLIGHNPGLEQFITEHTGNPVTLPTGALIVLRPQIDHWKQFDEQLRVEIGALWKPRDLSDS